MLAKIISETTLFIWRTTSAVHPVFWYLVDIKNNKRLNLK